MYIGWHACSICLCSLGWSNFFNHRRFVTGTTKKRGKERPRHAADAVKQHNQSVRTTEQQSLHLGLPKKGEKGGEDSQAGG